MFSDLMGNELSRIADLLWKDQSEKNWDALAANMKKGGAKYYRVFFEQGKLEKQDDLRKSYAELYDSKEKPIAKVPIFKTEGKKVEGATIYLKGLLNVNRVD